MSFATTFSVAVTTLALLSTLFFTNVSATTRPIFTIKAGNLDLHKICADTYNPSLCLQTLNSDPRTKTATNIHDIINISMDIATKRVGATHTTLNNLSAKTINRELKEIYSQCSGFYGKALAELVHARVDFGSGKMSAVSLEASQAVANEEDCKDQFEGSVAGPVQVEGVISDDIFVSYMVFHFASM